MKLQLEILSGRRSGEIVNIAPNMNFSSLLPFVLETDAFKIVLISEHPLDEPIVLLEDAEITLRFDVQEDNIYRYYAEPIYKECRPQSLFYNYFGIATFYLKYKINDVTELQELGQVEVLARKATVAQIESMINFILSTDESELLNSRGATRRGADVSSDLNDTPSRLLEKLESNLKILEENIAYIINRPITTLDTKLKVVGHNPYIDLQEQGISWLAENVSVFQQSTDPEATLLDWYGTALAPEYVQTSVIYESADIYENQIIMGYIDSLLSFLQEMLKETQDASTSRPSLNTFNGYVSFFGSVAEKLLKNVSPDRQRILASQRKLMQIRTFIQSKLHISKSDVTLPKFTPKVRANRIYALIFRSIIDWYRGSTINWEAKKLLIAIDNVPKLFELYTILLIRKWCQTYGIPIEKTSSCSWEGELFNHKARLYYEPIYWASGHINNDISAITFNTQIKTVNESKSDNNTRTRRGEYQQRCPDIVLELKNSKGTRNLLIFDAKYTKPELAFGTYLHSCIIKYVHGIGALDNPSITHSMVILFPGNVSDNAFLDFHMHPFSLFGETPQKPILGALGLSLKDETTKVLKDLDSVVRRAIELVE